MIKLTRTDNHIGRVNQSHEKCERDEPMPGIITTYHCRSFFSRCTAFEALRVFIEVKFVSAKAATKKENMKRQKRSRKRNKEKKTKDENQGNYFSSCLRSIVIDCLKNPLLWHHRSSLPFLPTGPLSLLLFPKTKPPGYKMLRCLHFFIQYKIVVLYKREDSYYLFSLQAAGRVGEYIFPLLFLFPFLLYVSL